MVLWKQKYKEKIKQLKTVELLLPYKKYLANLYRKSTLTIPEFPEELWVENTNVCNASCTMCPREKLTRGKGFMDLNLYEKIVREAAKYDVKRLHLHNFGEPLTDKKLSIRIATAKKLGIKKTYFVTNGSLLTESVTRDIIEAGLDEMKISFYGTDEKTYGNTMKGLEFNNTINNVSNFFKIRKDMRKQLPRVIIQYLPQESNRAETEKFVRIFSPFLSKDSGDDISIFSLHNFADGRDYKKSNQIYSCCSYPWRTMVILWDGTVASCCLDYNGIQALGNVNEESIYDIWHSKRFNQVRTDFRNLDYENYPICLKCDLIK